LNGGGTDRKYLDALRMIDGGGVRDRWREGWSMATLRWLRERVVVLQVGKRSSRGHGGLTLARKNFRRSCLTGPGRSV
jgi:hypothetical protein